MSPSAIALRMKLSHACCFASDCGRGYRLVFSFSHSDLFTSIVNGGNVAAMRLTVTANCLWFFSMHLPNMTLSSGVPSIVVMFSISDIVRSRDLHFPLLGSCEFPSACASLK